MDDSLPSDHGGESDRSTEEDSDFFDTRGAAEAQFETIGRKVFEEVWREFYGWEHNACLSLLDEVKVDGLPEPNNLNNLHTILDQTACPLDIRISTDDDGHIAEFYNSNGSCIAIPVLTEEVSPRKFDPYPTYESCTPTSKNLALRPDVLTENIFLPFIPYADEPNFDAVAYANDCAEFAWQSDMIDPDGTQYYS